MTMTRFSLTLQSSIAIRLVFSVYIFSLLIACGGGSSNSGDGASSVSPTPSPTPTSLEWGAGNWNETNWQ